MVAITLLILLCRSGCDHFLVPVEYSVMDHSTIALHSPDWLVIVQLFHRHPDSFVTPYWIGRGTLLRNSNLYTVFKPLLTKVNGLGLGFRFIEYYLEFLYSILMQLMP